MVCEPSHGANVSHAVEFGNSIPHPMPLSHFSKSLAFMPREYFYVGPANIREIALRGAPSGTTIKNIDDLTHWIENQNQDREVDGSLIATFVIDLAGNLRLAPRRSEHVACGSGGPVLSAGEITFSRAAEVVDITNQSTGFCPEPESWESVAKALDSVPVEHPNRFTRQVIFRLCPNCNQRNIVKDGWFICALCDAELPAEWNFQTKQ